MILSSDHQDQCCITSRRQRCSLNTSRKHKPPVSSFFLPACMVARWPLVALAQRNRAIERKHCSSRGLDAIAVLSLPSPPRLGVWKHICPSRNHLPRKHACKMNSSRLCSSEWLPPPTRCQARIHRYLAVAPSTVDSGQQQLLRLCRNLSVGIRLTPWIPPCCSR